MSDSAPDTLSSLLVRRAAIQIAIDSIRSTLADQASIAQQAQTDAMIASLWAVVMHTTGIMKIGMSFGDKRAAAAFKLLDKGIDKATEIAEALGGPRRVTKGELLSGVDAPLQSTAELLATVRSARGFLAKADIKPTGATALLLDLSQEIAEDTLLIMQAGYVSEQARTRRDAACASIHKQVQRLMRKLMALDDRIGQLVDGADLKARTA